MENLTASDILNEMNARLNGASPTLNTMLWLSYFLDLALCTGDLSIVEKVNNRIERYYLENFT